MNLAEWIAKQPKAGRGARTKLQRETGLAYTTILRAVAGEPMLRSTAEQISAATKGRVSVSELLVGRPSRRPSSRAA